MILPNEMSFSERGHFAPAAVIEMARKRAEGDGYEVRAADDGGLTLLPGTSRGRFSAAVVRASESGVSVTVRYDEALRRRLWGSGAVFTLLWILIRAFAFPALFDSEPLNAPELAFLTPILFFGWVTGLRFTILMAGKRIFPEFLAGVLADLSGAPSERS